LQTCSRDFLPLMSEANVLRVNGVPYLKLGVIGKGGSCKVYRALTKNCSVVAIKKVKLAGMERKAMSGYANEVALLKRLRGNPAIIQMIDSQLDLKRKQLLVVMEQGETDLNHVLHQQALSGATRGQERHRQLNMNFIRLTWHQMLSAVHCIHEARIVHGDLKPANFLFVKGALKLIDFGIAKAIQSEDTTNVYRDTQIGTLNYMSPEAIAADSGATQRNGAPRMKVGRVRQSAGLVPAEMF
jgi:serine/threonine-protein kinase TTK/MPS1